MMSESAEACYQSARQLYLKHMTAAELTEAAAQFAALGEYERAPWYLARCRTLLEFVPGHTVSYGTWNGAPIRWRVLEQHGFRGAAMDCVAAAYEKNQQLGK